MPRSFGINIVRTRLTNANGNYWRAYWKLTILMTALHGENIKIWSAPPMRPPRVI